MTEARWKLPQTWGWASAEGIASIVGGGTPSTRDSENFSERGIPWVTPADLTGYRQTYIARGARDLSSQGYASSGAQLIPQGSVLFSSRAPIGYCAVAANEIATNQGFKSLVLGDGIVPEYIRHYLLSAKEYAESLSSGTTFKELSGARMAALSIPIAPTAEQRRIVAKLDGLLGRTARALKELDHVPTLFAQYKRAIVLSATSGRLTKRWREEQKGIAAWRELTLADIADVQGGITKDSKKQSLSDEEVPYLRVANVQRGYLDLHEMKTIRVPASRLEDLLLEPGDILFNEGGDIDKLGRGWVWEGQIDRCSFQNHVFRARLFDKANEPKYVSWWGNFRGLEYFLRAGKQTTNLASINKTLLSRLPISLPPPEEQAEIVRRIESAFAWLDKLAAEHARASALLPKFEQALLAKAFRGELVPQDPNDEPASVLLERIRAERAAAPERQRKPRSSQRPRAPRQRAAMTKSRLDQDVMHQPYLAKHLRDAGGSARVEDLFRSADLPVTDFYKQLAWEVEAGHVNDQGALLAAA